MNRSNDEYVPFKKLLNEYKTCTGLTSDEIKTLIKIDLREFCKNFFGELYHDKEFMNKLFIAGGTIGNLYDFYENSNGRRLGRKYKECFSGTNIDIYINADVECEFKNIIKLIMKHKVSIVNNINVVDIVQIVKYVRGKTEYILSTIDFEHCRAHYLIGEDKLVITNEQLGLLRNKELVHYINNSLDPCDRLRKYICRGYKLKQTIQSF